MPGAGRGRRGLPWSLPGIAARDTLTWGVSPAGPLGHTGVLSPPSPSGTLCGRPGNDLARPGGDGSTGAPLALGGTRRPPLAPRPPRVRSQWEGDGRALWTGPRPARDAPAPLFGGRRRPARDAAGPSAARDPLWPAVPRGWRPCLALSPDEVPPHVSPTQLHIQTWRPVMLTPTLGRHLPHGRGS